MRKDYGVIKYQSSPKQWTVTATLDDYSYVVGTYDYHYACSVVRELREARHQQSIKEKNNGHPDNPN